MIRKRLSLIKNHLIQKKDAHLTGLSTNQDMIKRIVKQFLHLWQTLIEMMMGERGLSQIGLDVTLPDHTSMITQLFSENGGYVIAVDPENNEAVQAYLENALCDFQVVGQTISELTIQLSHDKNNWNFDLETLKSYWNKENQSRLGTPV